MGISMMFATNASAQGYIKVNPINLAFGVFGASYEGVVNEKSSFQVGAYFVSRWGYSGFGAEAQYRFYLSDDDAPRGLFVAPLVGVRVWGSDYTVMRLGGLIGYQWLFSDDKFSFELGVGPVYRLVLSDFDTTSGDWANGVVPALSLSLGYRIVE